MEIVLGQLAMTWPTTGKLESRLVARLGRPYSTIARNGAGRGVLKPELLCQDHARLVSLLT